MVGICSQWAIDERLKPNILAVYITIVRNSFGYKRRWCYLDYGAFGVSNRNTLSKILDELNESGIISVKHTFKDNGHRGKNEYMILEPKKYISNFVFDKKDSKEETIKEELPPW